MSKFFGEGNASSDSDGDNNEEGDFNKKTTPYYQYNFDENRGDSHKRVILTQKVKKWGQLKKMVGITTNALNNQDFDKVWEHLQELLTSIEKAQKLVDADGHPGFFIKFLMNINEEVTNLSAEDKKKLNKNSNKAFNTMRQKLKNKIMPLFESAIEKFKADGAEGDTDEEFKQQEQSSSESQQGDTSLLDSTDPMVRRQFWLKKKVQKKKQFEREGKPVPKDEVDPVKDQDKKRIRFNPAQKKEKKSKILATSKEAEQELKQMVKNFYKLKTQQEREDHLSILNSIRVSSSKYKDHERLSFRLADIPMRMEVSRQMKLTHFLRLQWVDMFSQAEECFQILRESEEDGLVESILQFDDGENTEKIISTEESVYNSIKSFIIILENQLRKAFMFIDNSDTEYSERLQDLIKFVNFMYRVSRQISFKGLDRAAAQISFKVIENMYFMSSSFMKKISSDFQGPALEFTDLSEESVLQEYARPVLRMKNDETVTKTILYLVFNHAVNYRTKAKDLLTMSNVPSIISKCDYSTQALYNRAIIQIGICAFRNGSLFEVQQYLSEVCGYAKLKEQSKDVIREFLAQGGRPGVEVSPTKILPYYLHLNCEMVEIIELIASMIQQVPYMLNEGGRINSKTFRKLISDYERSYFVAQPIRNKDLVYAASNCLKTAKWKECYERLLQLSVWKHLPDFDTVKANLLSNIKEQSLKCYLVGNRKCFTSISIDRLADKFQLPLKNVRKLVCKWLYNKDLRGSISSDGYLQIVQKKRSEMQKVSQQLFSKLDEVMKTNESIFESRNGGMVEEEEIQKDPKMRKTNVAMSQKIKATLSKRT